DPPRREDLDRSLGADVSDHRPLDDDFADVDFRLETGPLTDDQHVVREHLPLERTVDPDGPLERELALEFAPPAKEGIDFTHHSLLALRRGRGHAPHPITFFRYRG